MAVHSINPAIVGIFWCMIFFQSVTLNAENYITRLCCSLFGKEDASCKYKEIVHEALQAFGIKEFDQVPVKKIGKIPLRVIGDAYVSFTMSGIWLNEEMLAECPESEIVFILFHETAHYVFRDHGKQIISLIPATWLFYAIPHWSLDIINNQNSWLRVGYIGVVSAVTILLLDRLFMRPIARHLERNAELAAAHALCQVNKSYVVLDHIDYLKSLLNKGETSAGFWSYSLVERIEYVTAYYKELTAKKSINA